MMTIVKLHMKNSKGKSNGAKGKNSRNEKMWTVAVRQSTTMTAASRDDTDDDKTGTQDKMMSATPTMSDDDKE